MTDLQERAARLLGDGPYYDANRDVIGQLKHYQRHVNAMTAERLHSKADIAQELAHRDQLIEAQAAEIERLRAIADAAGRYYARYAQDEANDVEDCVCGREQHEDAIALRESLKGWVTRRCDV